MTDKPIKNISASVLQKLLNNAKQTNHPFTELLRYYTLERFLYRLTKSRYADKFVLKGALLFTTWKSPLLRSTKDIDLLGRLDNDVENIVKITKEICQQHVAADGIVFNSDTVTGVKIIEEAEYSGVRIKLKGNLGTARLAVQVDVGFGDVVYPAPRAITFPSLIDLPAPHLLGYSWESVIAEKFHIMINRGMLNSRLKDYYDVWMMTRQFNFKGKTLSEAIRKTFTHRGSVVSIDSLDSLRRFAEDPAKSVQWRGFLRNNRLENTSPELKKIAAAITGFLKPVILALAADKLHDKSWKAPGQWK